MRDSFQISGVRGQKLGLSIARKCATDGCNRRVWDDDYCPRCEDEICQLNRMAEEGAVREARAMSACELRKFLDRQQRVENFRRAGAFVQKWIWLPLVIFVIAGGMYIARAMGQAVIDWVLAGGAQ